MTSEPPIRTGAELIELLGVVRRVPSSFVVRTHDDLATLLHGIHLGTGLLPSVEMTDWLLGTTEWGGIGWDRRVAKDALDAGATDGRYAAGVRGDEPFTPDEERAMIDAIVECAVRWLERPEAS